MIAVALGCTEPTLKALAAQVPAAEVREAELLATLAQCGHVAPAWLTAVAHRLSRQSLLGARAAALTEQNEDLRERLFGDDGLLELWLCGDKGNRAGLLDKNGDPGAALVHAAIQRFKAVLGRRFMVSATEDGAGRCHFTNLPVGIEVRIDSKSGLDGIKTSAFSGRRVHRSCLKAARPKPWFRPRSC